MNFLKHTLLPLALATPAWAQQPSAPAAPEQPFSFVLPWNDASRTAIDASALNPAPLTESRRLRATGGHFRDATGRRVKLLGVNITAGQAFPTHEDAAQVAARLHKFGVNCVRLHHMDASWAQPNLFYISDGSANKPTQVLSPQSLDRLDFFVAQLKKNGIYVDLNLHVARSWDAANGFDAGAGAGQSVPEMGKVLAYFEPRAIALQEQFATQILTHFNPYTGHTYARDPAVALVEMNNEDSLLGSASSIGALPAPYQSTLQAQWNAWLRKAYGTNDKMLAAWNREAMPLGASFFPEGRLQSGIAGWTLEQHEGTAATLSVEDAAGVGGDGAPEGRALKLSPTKLDGTDWHLQLHRTGLDLKDGELYTISFAARASTSRSLGVGVRLDQDPWSNLGLDERIALSPAWKRFTFSFRARNPVANHARLSFVPGGEMGDVFLGDIALSTGGGSVALEAGQSLEAASVALGRMAPTTGGRDWASFLMDVEDSYIARLKSTIRATGSQSPLLCSQASYGGLGGVWRESKLDIVDMHAYWQHPNFPRQSWDMNDWLIPNTAMVRDASGGTLSGLASHRVQGKPFMVSEYDHPAPNEYAGEEVPMLLAMAAWQDWDGVFFFEYGTTSAIQNERVSGFFNHSTHPAKWAFLPTMARLWLGGQMSASPQSQVLVMPASQVASIVASGRGGDFWSVGSGDASFSTRSLLDARSSVRFTDASAARVERSASQSSTPGASSLSWRPADQAGSAGVFQFACPQAVGVTGFVGGTRASVGGASIEFEASARNFASLTLAALDGKPLLQSRSMLLTAVDKAENAGLKWNAARTFASEAWTGPIEAFGIGARISLPLSARAAKIFALDAVGARRSEVASRLEGGRLSFAIAPGDKTVWYEIAAS